MARPRGRPLKFGRPSRLVALTLPEDVLAWLRGIDRDPARAIVNLFDRDQTGSVHAAPAATPLADIAILSGRRGLILVDRQAFSGLGGVDLLPLDSRRAFLALRNGGTLADLELAVVDRMDELAEGAERGALAHFRRQLQRWRRDPAWRFEGRSIVVAEQRAGGGKRTSR